MDAALVALFDIDGTLLSSSGAGRLAMDAALAAEFGVQAPIAPSQIAGRTDRSIAGDQFRAHGIADSPDNWERFIAAYLARLPESLARQGARLLPGVADMLEVLRRREDAVVGLLTGNVPAGARLKLGHVGIDHYFEFGAFGDRHYTRDEVAHVALAGARERLGEALSAETLWVIGDTPWDVRCAQAISARAVAVATGMFSTEALAAEGPDLVLRDLSDAAALWDQWDE